MNKKEHKDLKKGEEVIFTKYESDDNQWEKGRGGFVGNKYNILRIESKDYIYLEVDDGRFFVVGVDQIQPVKKTEDLHNIENDLDSSSNNDLVNSNVDDLVNNPKHYATDPSGVECIQIKRKMSANAGDAFKYCWRVGKKWDDKQDLEKALWYINDAIEHNVPIWLDDGVDLETEVLIQKVLKRREGWQYIFINAMYWSDLEEAKRAVEIGIKQFEEPVCE